MLHAKQGVLENIRKYTTKREAHPDLSAFKGITYPDKVSQFETIIESVGGRVVHIVSFIPKRRDLLVTLAWVLCPLRVQAKPAHLRTAMVLMLLLFKRLSEFVKMVVVGFSRRGNGARSYLSRRT